MGWMGEVNPPGKDGWESKGSSLSEKGYGKNGGLVSKLKDRVEEVRKSEGYETNGRGVEGDGAHGYVVYGEYLRVVPRSRGAVLQNVKGQGVKGGMVIEEEVLEAKRERRVRRYEASTGLKVRRERVNRGEVVESMGRKRERGVMRRGRAMMERSHLEKVGSGSKGASKGSGGKVLTEEEVYGLEKRAVLKRSAGVVCTEAMAVVVVRSGVRRMERLLVKLLVRKREGAGREHRRIRREVDGRRKAHAYKSRSGRRYGGNKSTSSVTSEEKRKGGYYGYRVTVTGTLNGSRRTKRWEMGRGTVPQSRKECRRGLSEGVAKTSVGTLGVQVGYCYGLG